MKIDLTDITNIIFDLGNVLLNLDFNASIKAFQELGLKNDVLNRQQAYSDPVFYELEIGKVTPEEFRKKVREILNNENATDLQIDDAWSAMVLDIPAERVKIVQELRKNYNVYLFSNTNQIHIDRLLPAFKAEHKIDFPSLFSKTYYSHEIHERKPDLSSFKKVIKLSSVNPAESVFIDDLEKNILAAEKAGLKTFWLKDRAELAEIF
ncbi:MAG: HAD family phosphatase [Prolixibacteraceae bacterium]|jgi:glucose-1-phosphatase|nr:HAD family phosphatase [Prolixibacteraceae bacterium]MBT6007552.1 HAD family phosphatase [Prolixibacteraceae bacterium]MBT6765029.1 HAD family phosphatase [Prolixibacteraceae bacterium]MBT6998950.1 HAD family phosphatase [Prolixibacteraceae bacterium]MBT7393899.1 HAD family phosphatase [Prolixibacteraceae bacterium]